jgi:hypothetical protein
MFSIFHIVCLVLFGLYVFFKVDRTKPWPWMVAHAGVIAAGVFGILVHAGWYLGVGCVLGLVLAAKSLFVDKLAFASNVKTYVLNFVQDAFFSPVHSFEALYQWVSTKVKLPTLPKV